MVNVCVCVVPVGTGNFARIAPPNCVAWEVNDSESAKLVVPAMVSICITSKLVTCFSNIALQSPIASLWPKVSWKNLLIHAPPPSDGGGIFSTMQFMSVKENGLYLSPPWGSLHINGNMFWGTGSGDSTVSLLSFVFLVSQHAPVSTFECNLLLPFPVSLSTVFRHCCDNLVGVCFTSSKTFAKYDAGAGGRDTEVGLFCINKSWFSGHVSDCVCANFKAALANDILWRQLLLYSNCSFSLFQLSLKENLDCFLFFSCSSNWIWAYCTALMRCGNRSRFSVSLGTCFCLLNSSQILSYFSPVPFLSFSIDAAISCCFMASHWPFTVDVSTGGNPLKSPFPPRSIMFMS